MYSTHPPGVFGSRTEFEPRHPNSSNRAVPIHSLKTPPPRRNPVPMPCNACPNLPASKYSICPIHFPVEFEKNRTIFLYQILYRLDQIIHTTGKINGIRNPACHPLL